MGRGLPVRLPEPRAPLRPRSDTVRARSGRERCSIGLPRRLSSGLCFERAPRTSGAGRRVPYPRAVPTAVASVGGEPLRQARELPIEVECYELEANDREYRPSSPAPRRSIHLRAAARRGIGEDVVYEVLDHIANRDLGPRFDLTGPKTLGEFCELLGELDLFEGAPPEREASRHYRRWAYESAALDLALRQNGISAARGGRPRPEAAPLRLLDPALELRRRRDVVDRADPQAAASVPGPRVQARPRERLGRRS